MSETNKTTLSKFWDEAAAYAEGGDGPASSSAKADLSKAINELVGGERPKSVYVAKLTNNGLHNQFWQGKSVSEKNDVMVFLDQSSNAEIVIQAARDRLNPRPDSGFEAVVIGADLGGGQWAIHEVVEYDHSSIGARLKSETGGNFPIVKVPDPAATTRATSSFTEEPATGSPEDGGADAPFSAREIVEHLLEARNVVLEGPPGTGKTRAAFLAANVLAGGNARDLRLDRLLSGNLVEDSVDILLAAPLVWDFVQLHPSFGYEEFVRGMRTDPDVPGFALKSVDGILPQICKVAAIREGKPTLLIIDEINRANLSAVLGETIFAIDPAHRDEEVRLQYKAPSGGTDSLSVPANLLILGTMNTADRSIAMLDFAVRRRFRFLRMQPSRDAVLEHYSATPHRAAKAAEVFDAVMESVKQEDFQPGQSYFLVPDQEKLSVSEWGERFASLLVNNLRPLLEEYREEGMALGNVTVGVESGEMDLLASPVNAVRDSLTTWLCDESGS
ncbi:hypothetical protein DT603_08175 [Pseudoxanthomonas gei]|uniref:ATPase dynein-related AAA domain-containing protein n=1 Tax=Pseudoxanthomonas gei TaxID=1383030 RepID=A0ABX0AHV3_9GAMM|nr:AAA family ATPase [Pseudoxanthomonas gei]NDK38813.1 hypothetical protein [Pseudoxanthomonas gei]